MQFIFAILAITAYGAPICPPNRSQIQGPSEVARYFDRINVIGKDDRKSAKDFAKNNSSTEADVEKRYGASGDLACAERFGQAQVVLKNDLIVTAAHSLFRTDCNSPIDIGQCKFAIMENGKRKFYEVEKVEGAGYRCPTANKMKNTQDWIVLRLKKPVADSVKPYQLGNPPCANPSKPADVVRVAKSNDWGGGTFKQMLQVPRHFANCQVQNFTCGESQILWSDCDTSHNSSGGGTFIGGANPELVGITIGMAESCAGDAKKLTGSFNKDCWSSADLAITDDFRKELLRVAGQTPMLPSPPGQNLQPALRPKQAPATGMQDL